MPDVEAVGIVVEINTDFMIKNDGNLHRDVVEVFLVALDAHRVPTRSVRAQLCLIIGTDDERVAVSER